ncbi:MAG: LicD family protein [Bacteroidaceae bacterium]|nr:LicD family protein [Bacteroidaceae bacterium]
MQNIKYIKGDELRKLQLMLLDCLIETDRVCRANGIRYCIADGTLLGAIRHKGFIPWDDDIDVMMTREEYEKFTRVADQLDPSICFFQDNDTEASYPWGYAKIRRAGTRYIRVGQEHLKHRTGFMMDIFPMDDIPKSLFGQKLFYGLCFVLRKLTYAQVGWTTESSPLWRAWYKLLSFIPPRFVHGVSKLFQHRHNNSTPNRAYAMYWRPEGLKVKENRPEERYGWPKEWLTDLAEYEFEGHMFFGPKDYAGLLAWDYGPNYMTPPPEAERHSFAPCSDYSFGN